MYARFSLSPLHATFSSGLAYHAYTTTHERYNNPRVQVGQIAKRPAMGSPPQAQFYIFLIVSTLYLCVAFPVCDVILSSQSTSLKTSHSRHIKLLDSRDENFYTSSITVPGSIAPDTLSGGPATVAATSTTDAEPATSDASAGPTPPTSNQPTGTATASPATTSEPAVGSLLCTGFEGDDNIYGLGIRVGVYSQWVASFLVYFWVDEEVFSIGSVNLLFQFANFVALVYMTGTNGETQPTQRLYTAECWIVLLLCLGSVFPGLILEERPAPKWWKEHGGPPKNPEEKTAAAAASTNFHFEISKIGATLQLLMIAAILYYALWFAYVGMDRMTFTDCSRYAFAFARVDLYHRFRTFLKFLTPLLAALATAPIVLLPIRVFRGKNYGKAIQDTYTVSIGLPGASGSRQISSSVLGGDTFFRALVMVFNRTRLRDSALNAIMKWVIGAILFAFFLFFLVSIELAIVWNRVTGVNTFVGTGQLLPLILGLGSFVRVLYLLYEDPDRRSAIVKVISDVRQGGR